ncbi:MAG: hypothetical protein U5N10_12350 [Gemmobacter sp.]|nr:hypothetical protein [Gemmobacter sp.]
MPRLPVITLVGGLCGALLLMASSNAAFPLVMPFRLLGATLAFLFGDLTVPLPPRAAGQ